MDEQPKVYELMESKLPAGEWKGEQVRNIVFVSDCVLVYAEKTIDGRKPVKVLVDQAGLVTIKDV